MKNESMGIMNPIAKNDLKELLNETKETLSTDVKLDGVERKFGAVDLWNANKRQQKSWLLRKSLI